MNPGERITLIKRIAGTLSEQDYSDIRLTLGEFGVPYDDEFAGGLYEMVLDAGRGASDEALLELHAYLHPDARTQTPTSGGPWDPGAFRLFISHTHAHRQFAGALRTSLKRVGIDAFVAHDTIEPGSEWLDVIESALNTCDAAAALLTPDFRQSKWCDQEIGFCMARSVPIVVLRMPEDPHGFIGKYQGIQVGPSDSGSKISPRVFDLLAKHELTRSRMVRPVIQRYVRSGSYQNTRDVFPLLTAIPKAEWTDQMVEDVLSAAKNNTQVEQAILLDGRQVPEATSNHLAALGVLPAPRSPADDDIPF
jgi:hypothetical protein